MFLLTVAVLAGEAHRGTAAPSEASSQTRVASSDGIQREISFEKITNVIISLLPKITSLIVKLTEGLDEGQWKQVEVMGKFLIPIVRAIVETEASEGGITPKEEALLNDLETYLGAVLSLLWERVKASRAIHKTSVGEPIPDYTDTLDDTEPNPSHEHDFNIPVRKNETPSNNSNQRRSEDSVSLSPVVVKRKSKDSSPSSERRDERKDLGRKFFSLPT